MLLWVELTPRDAKGGNRKSPKTAFSNNSKVLKFSLDGSVIGSEVDPSLLFNCILRSGVQPALGQFGNLQVAELRARHKIMGLKCNVTRLLPWALIVIDKLTV